MKNNIDKGSPLKNYKDNICGRKEELKAIENALNNRLQKPHWELIQLMWWSCW